MWVCVYLAYFITLVLILIPNLFHTHVHLLRLQLRTADAPDCQTTACCATAQAFGGFMVRHRARFGWQHLSCDNRQFACESACDCHAAVLLISLHSAQTKNAFLCVDRCVSGRYAASNWLGVSNGHPEPGSMDALRHAVLLAVPTFHGNRVDVSR